MDTRLELINDETLALTFAYDAGTVAALKGLQSRRWNPRQRRWEVHLSHLADVMRILGLNPREVDPIILERYRAGGWVRCRLKVELDALQGRLTGSGAPVTAIDEATSFFVPGYKFSTKFIEKKWDGKRHLLNRQSHTFPAGLWPRVRRVLDEHEVDFEFVETAPEGAKVRGLYGEGEAAAALRPYQEAALKAALKARRGIIQMATGGGKTLLAAHLIRRVSRPAFFFVHTLDLLYQSVEVFRRELGVEVGILGDGQARLRALTVATVQTAARVFAKEPETRTGAKLKGLAQKRETAKEASTPGGAGALEKPARFSDDEDSDDPAGARVEAAIELDEATRREVQEAIEGAGLVIFDECHHVPADTFYKIAMRTRAAAWRIGLSATPWRDDHQDLLLEAALGETIHATNCSALIDQGYLVPARIEMRRAPRLRAPLRGVRYHDCYQLAIVENHERNRVIATTAREWAAAGRSVLILVAQVAHGQNLQKLLPEANFAYGLLDSAQRQIYLKELEQKLQPIMIATTLADEGLDVPSLGGVILAGGGKSQTRAYQRIGRALRPAPGKSEALVLDFLDEAPYLREHSAARLELYRQEPRFTINQCDGHHASPDS